jgi:hypothetical protein
VDHPHRGVGGEDRHEEPDRALGIDGLSLQNLGFAGLEIDRAMDVHAVPATARCNGDLLVLGSPAAHHPRLMGGMNGIDKYHRLVGTKNGHQAFVGCDEGSLLGRVETVGNHFGLAIMETQPMQQRKQPSVAVRDPIGLGDPRPDHSGVTRQRRAHPLEKRRLLGAGQVAFAAFVIENDDSGQAMLGIQRMPRADGVVIDKKGRGDLLAAPAVVQQDESIGPANNPPLAPAVTGQGAELIAFSGAEKSGTNHVRYPNPLSAIRKASFSRAIG